MSIPSFSLEGKVALITGGRRGIGKTFALAFAEAGADIAVCDYTDEGSELEAVAREVEKLGRKAVTTRADITKSSDVEKMVTETVDRLGTIDILVNNAGIGAPLPAIETDEELWDRVIDTHIKGYYLCSKIVAKKVMIPRQTGNIINMGSVSGLTANVTSGTAYNVAKAGVIMLNRGLSRELAPYNIRVNAIGPWVIETKMPAWLFEHQEVFQKAVARTPLGRLGTTEDLVGAALFLASEASSWVTGHHLVVDGGFMA